MQTIFGRNTNSQNTIKILRECPCHVWYWWQIYLKHVSLLNFNQKVCCNSFTLTLPPLRGNPTSQDISDIPIIVSAPSKTAAILPHVPFVIPCYSAPILYLSFRIFDTLYTLYELFAIQYDNLCAFLHNYFGVNQSTQLITDNHHSFSTAHLYVYAKTTCIYATMKMLETKIKYFEIHPRFKESSQGTYRKHKTDFAEEFVWFTMVISAFLQNIYITPFTLFSDLWIWLDLI